MSSWTSGNWSQNDSYYEGLPYITTTGYSPAPDMSNVKFIWSIISGVYESLPYITASGVASVPDMTDVKFIWAQTRNNNFDLLYIEYMENIGAFTNCTDLTSVTIPASVKYIDYYSFWNTGLTSVTIASDCKYYPTSFPSGCTINFYS